MKSIRNSLPYRAIAKTNRKRILKEYRERIENQNFSILASNCMAGFFYHDLAHPFLSPTINLYLDGPDYIKFLKDLDSYLNLEIEAHPQSDNYSYPLGLLGDLSLHFVHYDSLAEAIAKWQERKERLNLDNLFVVATDRDGMTIDLISEFDALDYPHKVVFTHQDYPELQSAFYIPGFEDQGMVGELNLYRNLRGERLYDQFDFVSWLNQK